MTIFYILLSLCILLLLLDRLLPATAARWGLGLERWRSGLRCKTAMLPGFTMPYLVGGTGEPLLLIHGFAGDKDNFTRLARFLTPHFRLICPDLPGFGAASRDPQASYSMVAQAERVIALMDSLGLQRVHLGGNSMGGFIATQLAAQHPGRVASLWLLDAAGTAAAHDTEVFTQYQATGDMPLLVRREADFARLMQATTHKAPFLPYCVRITLARRAVADLVLHSRILQQLSVSPLLEVQFPTIATPALIVWGTEDRILNPTGAQALHALMPHSTVLLMPHIGHLPMLEAPRRTARDYLQYRQALGEA
jgi:triacylglycerol lipase